MSETKPTSEAASEYLQRITRSLLNLPTLPTVAARLIDLVDNPRANANMMAQLISQDQVLTARLLKMCNSAYFGLGREITGIQDAVVLLGFENVKEIGLGVTVINAFRSVKGMEGFDIQGFWDHSSAVGTVARSMAKRFRPELATEAFTAGLLHDIGKVVLLQYLPEPFALVLQEARTQNRELWEVEREHLGTDHGEVGSWLATRWKLPQSLRMVMLNHHHLEKAEEHLDLAALVMLADILCRLLKAGDGGNPASPRFPMELRERVSAWGIEPTAEGMRPLLEGVAAEIEAGNTKADWIR